MKLVRLRSEGRVLRGMFGMRVYISEGVFDGVFCCGLSEMSILSKKKTQLDSRKRRKRPSGG